MKEDQQTLKSPRQKSENRAQKLRNGMMGMLLAHQPSADPRRRRRHDAPTGSTELERRHKAKSKGQSYAAVISHTQQRPRATTTQGDRRSFIFKFK